VKRTWLLVGGWLLFTELLIPALIVFLYSSELLSSIEAVREARAEQSLDYFLFRWRNDTRWATAVLVGYLAFAAATRRPGFAPRWVPKVTPVALGAVRVLVCSILLGLTLAEHLPSTALLPREMIHEPGVLGILYALPTGFERLVASPAAMAGLQTLTALLLLLGALGVRTRRVLPLAVVAYLVLGAIPRQYSSFYHQGLASLYLLTLLSFAPSGDGLSLDRLARKARGLPVPAAARRRLEYGWPLWGCWALLALFYFQSGASKLRRSGLAWLEPDSLRTIVVQDSLQPMSFEFTFGLRLLSEPDWLVTLLALGAVAVELLFPLVLVSKLTRRVWPLAAVGLHVGIFLLQRILFVDLIALQLIFWSGRVWRAMRARRRGTRPRGAPNRLEEWLTPLASKLCGQGGVVPSSPAATAIWSRRLRRVVGLLLFFWAVRIESYPLTAWQMYSSADDSGRVDYQRVVARYESGDSGRAPLEMGIPALDRPLVAGTRYRRLIGRSFDHEDDRRVAETLLRTSAERYNAMPRGRTIVEIEVERWLWDFRVDERAELADRYSVPID
jgi:hypothetical protein